MHAAAWKLKSNRVIYNGTRRGRSIHRRNSRIFRIENTPRDKNVSRFAKRKKRTYTQRDGRRERKEENLTRTETGYQERHERRGRNKGRRNSEEIKALAKTRAVIRANFQSVWKVPMMNRYFAKKDQLLRGWQRTGTKRKRMKASDMFLPGTCANSSGFLPLFTFPEIHCVIIFYLEIILSLSLSLNREVWIKREEGRFEGGL